MSRIIKIEPKEIELPRKLKVAAYARVSVETERLAHSLAAQISFYSELIQKNPKWEYAGVYADSFISGTETGNRLEFQRMIEDCEKGLIDIILCKSISRFARNTVDILETVRRLRNIGVEVQFEKENIHTLSADGELMLSILASFAQEESRSISDNVKWGIRRRYEMGISCSKNPVFGYRWEGDELIVIPEEAVIVKRIFQNFLDGKSRLETEREFENEGIKTRKGCRWVDSNIKCVLSNITYTGNLLLQKEFIEDPINKKRRKNHGELPQYLVENTHEPIIDMETFQWVQDEMARRRELGPRANKSLNISCFTGKIKCPFCNMSYVHNLRTNRGFQEYWTCCSRKKKGGHCPVGGSIRHSELKKCCCEILGIDEFNDDVFYEKVDYIVVPKRETIEVHLKNGEVHLKECKNNGRKECWTPEARARASLTRLNNEAGNAKGGSCFTKKIKCVQCLCNFRRQSSGGIDKNYWRCSRHMNGCIGLCEDVLKETASRILMTDEFDEKCFSENIERINVTIDKLEFCFKDGRSVTDKYIPPKHPKIVLSEEAKARKSAALKASWTEERRQKASVLFREMRKNHGKKSNKNTGIN